MDAKETNLLAAGNGPGGGKPPSTGSGKGDLYGDQYVLLRDVDPSGGGGNGEPVLDANGQPILVGSDGLPIYYELTVDGDYEIPADRLVYAQTVDLGRANVARAPESVMQKALQSALLKIDTATEVSTDAAGRLMCDGVVIDSPLENLALYRALMTAGAPSSWPEVVQHWPESLQALVGPQPLQPDWDPASLLGAAFSKESPISMDAVLYENTVLGVNAVLRDGNTSSVRYFDFTAGQAEAYQHDRASRYEGLWLQWYADTDGDSTTLEQVRAPVLEAVFGGAAWRDEYWVVGTDPMTFTLADASTSGVNDFAQAVEDSRAVIQFMHATGAVTIPAPAPSPPGPEASAGPLAMMVDGGHGEGTTVLGTQHPDTLITGGGPQTILGGNGADSIEAGAGPDHVEGENGGDWIQGGPGPDVLIGGNGPDVIEGGAAHDSLTGGHGPDRFVYASGEDAPGGSGHEGGHDDADGTDHGDEPGEPSQRRETITDFEPKVDCIDLSALDGVTAVATEPMAHAVWWVADGDDTLVFVDTDGLVDGDHPQEMLIRLVGVAPEALSASDFLMATGGQG
jgi:RTX calcium-binding nonapeptide repeat (4 copies)